MRYLPLTPDDRSAFNQRTDCEVKEYGSFQPVPGVNLNGKLTLGENTADNGGIHIAWQALLETLRQDGRTIDDRIDVSAMLCSSKPGRSAVDDEEDATGDSGQHDDEAHHGDHHAHRVAADHAV